MIQRFLYSALKDGIAAIEADISILEDLFKNNYCLESEEVANIVKAFRAKPPTVIHNYPRRDMVPPLYSIVLGMESEGEHHLGDLAGQVDDEDDPAFRSDILSSIWEHTYHIYTVTEHPDLTSYYYELAKSILLAAPLPGEGLFEIHLSGADLSPDPRYLPEHLFVRQLTFKCQREFQRIDLSSLRDKAFRISGIHVDKSGSPSDVGGVKTLVTPYGVGDGTEE